MKLVPGQKILVHNRWQGEFAYWVRKDEVYVTYVRSGNTHLDIVKAHRIKVLP